MLKLSSNLQNLNVVSLRASAPVALALDAIINPHNLKIIGWWCQVPGFSEPQVLLVEDIREVTMDSIAIDDDEDLSPPEDLVRIREILDIDFDLIGKPVRTKRGKLGKVSDFSYNDGMFVQKLYVERPMHKILTTEDTVLIDRNQILEVTDNYILVKDTDVGVKEPKLAASAEPA